MSADGVSVLDVVSLVCLPFVFVLVLNSSWFQSTAMLVTEITFCWRTVHIRQHVCFLCLSILYWFIHPTFQSLSPHFSLRFLPESLGIPFGFGLCHSSLWLLYVNRQISQERTGRLSM